MTEDENVSARTLDLLESRLRRLNFVLHGDAAGTTEASQDTRSTAAARLRHLERQLANLAAKSTTAAQVLNLQHSTPTLFHPASDTSADGIPTVTLATLVLTHGQAFHQTQQQLSTLDNLAIPDPATLVPLVDLQSRIDSVAAKQKELAVRSAALRARSVQLLESWYANGLLNMSEHWTDWEERLRDVEILVRRMEAAKKRETAVV